MIKESFNFHKLKFVINRIDVKSVNDMSKILRKLIGNITKALQFNVFLFSYCILK